MQKKLLAVAVAGALGSPAVVLAQTSTVQIYGTMYVEYAIRADQGNSAAVGNPELSDADFLQTPGSSIGFKGEEKLGGGLSAWFQCESTADPRGQGQEGWCSRNSALGLKGGFGNLFIGNWDTPFKRTMGPAQVGTNDTGIFGSSFLLTGGSTTTAVGGTRGTFRRRQNNSINYDSPKFGGFGVMASFSSSQPSTATLDAASNNKPRVMSIGAQYSAGPIYVGLGYERHDEFNGGGRNADDDGWHIGAAYTWGPVRFGGVYTRQEFELGTAAAPGELEVDAWMFGVDWKIAGPHGLRAAYVQVDDVDGTPGFGGIAGSGSIRPVVPAAGAPNDTGAKLWHIRYVYTFSKRTEFTAGFAKLSNDGSVASGGGAYRLGGLGAAVAPGNNEDAWAVALRHRF
jgi:predicted porin